MKKIVLNLLYLFAIVYFVYSCDDGKTADKSKAADKYKYTVDVDSAHKHTYYCPMKCEGDKVYHEKGTCPKCNMDLVEVKMCKKCDKPKKDCTCMCVKCDKPKKDCTCMCVKCDKPKKDCTCMCKKCDKPKKDCTC